MWHLSVRQSTGCGGVITVHVYTQLTQEYVYIKRLPIEESLRHYCLVKWWDFSTENHPAPHLRGKCFLFRMERVGRELKLDGNMEETNYTEKYQMCHLLFIPDLPSVCLSAQRNYNNLIMPTVWWFEGAKLNSWSKSSQQVLALLN